jgi:hypothetical protein
VAGHGCRNKHRFVRRHRTNPAQTPHIHCGRQRCVAAVNPSTLDCLLFHITRLPCGRIRLWFPGTRRGSRQLEATFRVKEQAQTPIDESKTIHTAFASKMVGFGLVTTSPSTSEAAKQQQSTEISRDRIKHRNGNNPRLYVGIRAPNVEPFGTSSPLQASSVSASGTLRQEAWTINRSTYSA